MAMGSSLSRRAASTAHAQVRLHPARRDRPPATRGAPGRSAEEVAEERLLLPLRVAVPGGGLAGAAHLGEHVRNHGAEVRPGRAVLLVAVAVVLLSRLGARTAVPGVLGVDEPVELTAVEEDAPAVGALVDVDAVALVGAHRAVAFGTAQLHARPNG